jgi:hypothetical protein
VRTGRDGGNAKIRRAEAAAIMADVERGEDDAERRDEHDWRQVP